MNATTGVRSDLINNKKTAARTRFKKNIPLLIMFSPIVLFFIVFKYIPMGGLIIAFKSYNFTDGIFHSKWIGWDNFKLLFNNPNMFRIIKNTFVISLLSTLIGFPFPIILAILINELRHVVFKRLVQTLVYLPHFLSWVIVGSFVVLIFAQEHGIINKIIRLLFNTDLPFLYRVPSWLGVYFGSGIWKEAGFGAIIYLAALGGIDTSLYESAALDGANKFRQIWHVTIPGLVPIIVLMFILSLEGVMDVGFEKIYVLRNSTVMDVAEVISTWSYTIGLGRAQFSLATALGLFQSLVGLVLVLTTNSIARRFNQGLW